MYINFVRRDYEFRWINWNVEHVGRHNVSMEEAEYVVRNNQASGVENRKFFVTGKTREGRWIQVVYIFDPINVVFVIHSRDLSDREKKQARKRRH
jgi:uncharacterized DUF497 family protein